MVFKHFRNLKNQEGVTLVEIVAVVSIIAMFSLIMISNFPAIQRSFALSRAAYNLEQNMRRTEDLSLSGVPMMDLSGIKPIPVKGYGLYINSDNSTLPAQKYLIYADVNGDKKYNTDSTILCSAVDQTFGNFNQDCIVELIDLGQQNKSVNIKSISNINGTYTSINFVPPNPTITIDNKISGSQISIVLGLTSNDSLVRTITVNTSGLISVY